MNKLIGTALPAVCLVLGLALWSTAPTTSYILFGVVLFSSLAVTTTK